MKLENFVQEAVEAASAAPSDGLVQQLNKVLADDFLFYFKAHSFHWNVEGKDFPQYHEFLGSVYEQAFGAVDKLAEEIRALGSYAPMSLNSLVTNSSLSENTSKLTAADMISALASDNQKILGGLLACQKMAEAANQVGLANYLQDLFDQHKKLAWMLSSILKG